MRRRFCEALEKATAPAPTNSNRANARSGTFAGRKKSSKKATKDNRLFMADKTQAARLCLHDPSHEASPSALIQSPSCAVNVNDRVLTFAIIAQVWTAGDDHRENGCLAHRPRGRAQLCGDPNPGQGTSACPNCPDGARRSISPISPGSELSTGTVVPLPVNGRYACRSRLDVNRGGWIGRMSAAHAVVAMLAQVIRLW
jgi:hypothetical protein